MSGHGSNGRVAFQLATDAARNLLKDLVDRPEAEEMLLAEDVPTADYRCLLTARDFLVCDVAPSPRLSAAAATAGVRIVDFVDFYSVATGRLPVVLVDEDWLRRRTMAVGRDGPWRRWFDRVAGAFLLVLTAPVQLAVGLSIAMLSGSPVLIHQRRLGEGKRPFVLLKFRTMIRDAEPDGPRWARRDDPRVTRLGKFLRRYHLDELPQLVNVIRGELALIGPRPIRDELARRLSELQPLFDSRFLIRQGLTGWAQVNGPGGATEAEQMVKLEHDLYYLTHASCRDDLRILWLTVCSVAAGRGV